MMVLLRVLYAGARLLPSAARLARSNVRGFATQTSFYDSQSGKHMVVPGSAGIRIHAGLQECGALPAPAQQRLLALAGAARCTSVELWDGADIAALSPIFQEWGKGGRGGGSEGHAALPRLALPCSSRADVDALVKASNESAPICEAVFRVLVPARRRCLTVLERASAPC